MHGPEQQTIQDRYNSIYSEMAANAKISGSDCPLPSPDQILETYVPLTHTRDSYFQFSAREATAEEQEAHKNQFLDAKMAPLLEQYDRSYAQRLDRLFAEQAFHGHDKYKPQFAPMAAAEKSELEGVDNNPQTGFFNSRGNVGGFQRTLAQQYQHHLKRADVTANVEFAQRMQQAQTEASKDDPDAWKKVGRGGKPHK